MLKIITSKDTQTIKKRLLDRAETDYTEQQEVVDAILKDVRTNGDSALFALTEKLDGTVISKETVVVSKEEIDAAFAAVEPGLLQVMKEAAANIEQFHAMQKRENWFLERENGAVLGQLYLPVESAGVYVPGGKAAYPSSVLMNIIPAKCAGVPNIYVATPAKNGKIPAVTIVAACIAGAHRIFKIGGAQAVAAFAYGTQSIPRTDKITGPGNIYVALAKKRVYGQVGIDMIAGPSEVLIIADKNANAKFVAADFLSQAEHDELAACVLVTDDAEFAERVRTEIEAQVQLLPKKDIAEVALSNYGTIILCDNMQQCIDVSNSIAPEHLEICTQQPRSLLSQIKNAGSIFLGEYSPEPLGDYYAGTNHVLPTNGTARFSSPLNVDDFQKKSSVIYYTKEEFEKVYQKVEVFAKAEGLEAHARSAAIRFDTNSI